MDTLLTTDSRSYKEYSEQESHVESTTTITTGEKRKRTAGNVGVHDVRITVRCGSIAVVELHYSEPLNCGHLVLTDILFRYGFHVYFH